MKRRGERRSTMSAIRLLFVLSSLLLASCSDAPDAQLDRTSGTPPATRQATRGAVDSEGSRLFDQRCGTCHSLSKEVNSPVGPLLQGVVGRVAGSLDGFAYSSAMRTYAQPWTRENLDRFLENPAVVIPGNNMALGGIGNAGQRQLIIEYIAGFN